jgi:predicted GNAT family acetyltransferase
MTPDERRELAQLQMEMVRAAGRFVGSIIAASVSFVLAIVEEIKDVVRDPGYRG